MSTTKPKGRLSQLLSFLLSKLPWAAKPPPPAPAPAPEPLPTPRLGKKILIVDDDAVILHVLSHKLRARGYDIATAAEPADALAAVRDEKPDLILLDLVFPPDTSFSGAADWDGFALMRWLRVSGVGSEIPIFIISSADPDECKERCTVSGPAAYFQKPIDLNRLFLTIGQTLWKDANTVKSGQAEPDGVRKGS